MNSRTLFLLLTGAGVLAYLLTRRARAAALPGAAIERLPGIELPGVALPLLEPVARPEISPFIVRPGDRMPRGLRNNNPGNIKISASPWQGKVIPNTDGTFEQFTDARYGLRALARTLFTYQSKHGLRTVRQLITRWSATDQAPYLANVARAVGVGPDDAIDLFAKPEKMRALIAAIVLQENGQQPFTSAVIDAAVQAARN